MADNLQFLCMYSCIVLYFASGFWLNKNELNLLEPPGRGMPYMGRIGMCRCVGYDFQAEDGIRDSVASRGLGDVYKRQPQC